VEILSFIMSIIFVVVMGVITQKILENKGYKLSVEWVLLVLFLPPSAPLIALSMGPNPEKFGKCPYCRGIIELGATVCPHCGRDITTPLPLTPRKFVICPHCRGIIEPGATVCSYCGHYMTTPLPLTPGKFGECPHCRGIIKLSATVCPHCGRYITTPLSLTPQQQASQQTTSTSSDFSQQQTSPQQTPQQQASQQTTSTSPDVSQQQTTQPKPQIQITPTLGLKEKKKK